MADYNWNMEDSAGGFMGLMSKPDMSSNDGRQDESEERIDNQPGGSSPSPLELTKGHGDSDTGVLGNTVLVQHPSSMLLRSRKGDPLLR